MCCPPSLKTMSATSETRESVEKADESKLLLPAIVNQKKLIRQLILDIPAAKEMLEYAYILESKIPVNKVAKSITGHLLAAHPDYIDGETVIDTKLRKYLLNNNELPPYDMRLLWYVYPFPYTVIARNNYVDDVLHENPYLPRGIVSCLYFYPLAFVLCEKGSKIDTIDLFHCGTRNIEDIMKIEINLLSWIYPNTNKFRDPEWLCTIEENGRGANLLLFNDEIMNASVSTMKK